MPIEYVDAPDVKKRVDEIIEEMNKLTARQKELGFSDLEYSLLLTLEKRLGSDPRLVKDVAELSTQIQEHMFTGWYLQKTAQKNIARIIRRFLRRYIKEYGLKLDELEELYQNIIENVRIYGRKS